jgi:uncharacterized protein with HEPN domain
VRDGEDRTTALLLDIAELLRDAARIVGREQDTFFDRADRTQRLAAKAIVIDLQTAADQLPDSFRDRHPDVPWPELRAMRNYLAHDYANTDYFIVWNAIARDFPALGTQLGL